jgi:phosphoglycolate phosphatase-like HAD superfamily hydrolase
VRAIAIDLDGVLGDTHPLWQDWLADASRRFASIAPLAVDSLPGDRAEAAAALDRWAEAGVGDWRVALGRYAADRAPVYLRPNAEASGALRRLQAAGVRLGAFTDAPEALAQVAAAQLGATRRLEVLEAGAGALDRVLARLGPDAQVVRTRGELIGLA